MIHRSRSLSVLAGFLAGALAISGTTTMITAHAAAHSTAMPEVVATDRGVVRGTVHADHRTFEGIPYAAPPERWQPPQPATPWTGVRDARKPGPRCAQPADPSAGTPASTAEDCLHLNVTTPTEAPERPRPVAVWFHGGGFRTGSGSEHDAARMANRGDMVVVTVNYRLGALGFAAPTGVEGAGAFGLLDQQAALRWVQRNALHFGGDPGNVSIFGDSAGGDSVCAQLASPAALGLFHRAVVQSGTCTETDVTGALLPGGDPERTPTWKSRDAAESLTTEVAAQVGCAGTDVLECLRDVPVKRLLTAADGSGQAPYWSPAVGGDVLPRSPADAIASGRFNRVPVLAGATRDEGTLLAAPVEPAIAGQPRTYREFLAAAFGDRADAVERRYPLDGTTTPGGRWAQLVGDRAFACPNLEAQRTFAKWVPTYAYEFADRGAPQRFAVDPSYPMGAYHGADVPYLLDPSRGDVDLEPDQRRLSNDMIDYWTTFMASGDPNVASAPTWRPMATEHTRRVQSLSPGATGPRDPWRDHRCGFWADMDG
ncbi:para-nitrobenzyl esterase [Prauserella aidingensis]|uniref:carboxylesterase/lipase family protein n=1 Tax=Prauserella aidingensis TaxID=387890 RepID=UPI0020A5AA92|nr:carboxylesterase family protein [Prauserella aidingensis]MCP2252348.1 para-nitrobenzyl esterase [Prauserella aidingensis]